jgi:transposase InsO family protein
MCQSLEVSKSGYYNWLNRKLSKRKQENILLLYAIKEVFFKSREIYGSPRVCEELNIKGYSCSEKLVERLMRISNLRSKINKKYKVTTTNSNHKMDVSRNLLEQNFDIKNPGEVWVSDITYVKVNNNWMYLTVILDLFNREILGWDLSCSLETKSLIIALRNSVKKYKPNKGCIFHSDRGVQYASKEFRLLLNELELTQSMSGHGNCYDNACAETFFKTLKVENIYHKTYISQEEARRDLFEYIEIFYNQERLHSYLGYKSPKEYRKLYYKKTA